MAYSGFRQLFQWTTLYAIVCTFLLTQGVEASPLSLSQRSLVEEVRAAYTVFKKAGSLEKRDVVVPPIIKPDANSVWPIGSVQEVVWETKDFPPDNQISNPIGRVLLGRDTGDSLNLDVDNPLAQGFHIRLGRINITVPNVPPRDDYLVVLLGNSGNTSPSFAITRIDGGTPPKASSSATSSTINDGTVTPSLPGIAPTRSTEPPPFTSESSTSPEPSNSGTTITGPSPSGSETTTSTPPGSPTTTTANADTAGANQDGDDDDDAGTHLKLNAGLLLGAVTAAVWALV